MLRSTTYIVVGLSCLALTGCATKIQYNDSQAVETVNTAFGSTDLQQIAAKMVDSLLISPRGQAITQNKRPILLMDQIKNKTMEHIDTESITDTIQTKLLQSGRFQWTDLSNHQAVAQQLKYQSESGFVDPGKAISIGRHVGAEYLVYGNISSIVKKNNSTEDVYYKFTLKVMDLKSGLLEWADEKEIRKNASRSFFGL
jgi:uncharacterized protein (TIGR02722 family)